MKNTLAENMLRFGVKNLNESQLESIQSLIKEYTAPPALPAITGLDGLKDDPNTKTVYSWVNTKLSQFDIKFSNAISDPAAYLTAGIIADTAYYEAKFRKKMLNGTDIVKLTRSKLFTTGLFSDQISGYRDYKKYIVQFNESPSQKGKVATRDVITAAGALDGSGEGQASDYTQIQMFLNDSALKQYLIFGESINIEPYQSAKGAIVGGDFFTSGNPKTTPGAGALDLTNLEFDSTQDSYAYCSLIGTVNYDPESSQTTGTTTTTTTFEPGAEISPELGELFATGKIQLAAGKADEIAAAVKDAQKLGKIVKIRIESSASANRGTTSDRAAFAKMVGLPVDQVPQNPGVNNKSNNVTDPMEGGNAFLAVKRAQVAGAAVKSVSPVTPTITAKIQDGGDAAQYVKVFMTVQKPDNTTTVTQDDLKNIGAGASNDSLAGKFQAVYLQIP